MKKQVSNHFTNIRTNIGTKKVRSEQYCHYIAQSYVNVKY